MILIYRTITLSMPLFAFSARGFAIECKKQKCGVCKNNLQSHGKVGRIRLYGVNAMKDHAWWAIEIWKDEQIINKENPFYSFPSSRIHIYFSLWL